MKKAIVTGGYGFIGSAIVKNLLNKNIQVLNIDKLTYASNLKNISKKHINYKNFKFLKSDIANPHLENKIINYDPDFLINAAAETHVDNSIKKPNEFIKTNILGTFNLIKICKKIKNKKFRFIQVSTDEVFGDLKRSKKKFNHLSKYNPSSPYSASKASAVLLLKSWFRTFDLNGCITISSNNYGPNQDFEKLIPKIILNCIKNKKIPIYNKGKEKRNWLYVEDNAEAIVKVALKGKNRKSYLIGSNECFENIYVAKEICKMFDKIKPNIKTYQNNIIFVKDRPGHDMKYDIDSSITSKELNWKTKRKFNENILLTINSYLNK